jgi:hypothetical protein
VIFLLQTGNRGVRVIDRRTEVVHDIVAGQQLAPGQADVKAQCLGLAAAVSISPSCALLIMPRNMTSRRS